MLAFLAAILPGVLLPAFKTWVGGRNAEAARIADERMDARRQRHESTRAAMAHKPFWLAWSLFAVPLGIWWSAVLLDTTFSFAWSVPDLPNSIKPWAETIFQSLFWSGGGMAGVQVAAKAFARR